MKKVYFISRHDADSKMVEDVGGIIYNQFRGSVSGIKGEGEEIVFLETPLEKELKPVLRKIPADSILVLVANLATQIDFLRAGVDTLLVPITKRREEDGKTFFDYSGLERIKKIEIMKEIWAGRQVTVEEKIEERRKLFCNK